MFLTPEQLSNFPVEHLSPSAIRSALSNPQEFFMRYVRYIFDTKKSPAMVEGDCVHQIIEQYWLAQMEKKEFVSAEVIDPIIRDSLTAQQADIDFGKTGSLEKSEETIRRAFDFYIAELPDYHDTEREIVAIEQKMLSDFEDLQGNRMPVALKGYIDLAYREGEAVDIVDHKVVSRHKTEDDCLAAYELQAAPYFFLFRKHFGVNPRRMIFDELKKSKNKDGSPQRVPVIIEFTPQLLNRWLEVYRRVCKMLAGVPLIDQETGVIQFLPNPFAQFGAEESWNDFCEEVDEGKVWTFNELKTIRASNYKRAEELELVL